MGNAFIVQTPNFYVINCFRTVVFRWSHVNVNKNAFIIHKVVRKAMVIFEIVMLLMNFAIEKKEKTATVSNNKLR